MLFKSVRNSSMELQMHNIKVSIVYATRDKQWQRDFTIARGTSAGELLMVADMQHHVADLVAQGKGVKLDELSLGVFSIPVDHDYLLEEGDRLEIYRPLTADPKEVRRQLALLGKAMGKTKANEKAKKNGEIPAKKS